jgi:hypothetical protein
VCPNLGFTPTFSIGEKDTNPLVTSDPGILSSVDLMEINSCSKLVLAFNAGFLRASFKEFRNCMFGIVFLI